MRAASRAVCIAAIALGIAQVRDDEYARAFLDELRKIPELRDVNQGTCLALIPRPRCTSHAIRTEAKLENYFRANQGRPHEMLQVETVHACRF